MFISYSTIYVPLLTLQVYIGICLSHGYEKNLRRRLDTTLSRLYNKGVRKTETTRQRTNEQRNDDNDNEQRQANGDQASPRQQISSDQVGIALQWLSMGDQGHGASWSLSTQGFEIRLPVYHLLGQDSSVVQDKEGSPRHNRPMESKERQS